MVMEFQKEGPPPSGVGVRSLEHPAAETEKYGKKQHTIPPSSFLFVSKATKMNFIYMNFTFTTPQCSTG